MKMSARALEDFISLIETAERISQAPARDGQASANNRYISLIETAERISQAPARDWQASAKIRYRLYFILAQGNT
jgi:hypothetical protein